MPQKGCALAAKHASRDLLAVLVCPYDYGTLHGTPAAGFTCGSCRRTYPSVRGIINFLAYEEAFRSLTYDLPHHPVPIVNARNRVLAKIRNLPGVYYRLPVTSDHFSFVLERLIYKAVKSHKAVLDIGCREGSNLLYGRKADVCVGVDIDFKSVDYARQMSPHCATFLASGTCLPFASGTFDVVLCCDVIEHVEEYDKLVKEIGRVTQPKGVLVLSTPDGNVTPKPAPFHVKHFTEGDLVELLTPNFGEIDLRSVVRNCPARKSYWAFTAQFPHRKLQARLLNAWTNFQYYRAGYQKRESFRRADVTGSTFIITALRKCSEPA
jgi:SAM-dependent methyltransferase